MAAAKDESEEGDRTQLLRKSIAKIQQDAGLDGAEKSKRIQVKISGPDGTMCDNNCHDSEPRLGRVGRAPAAEGGPGERA